MWKFNELDAGKRLLLAAAKLGTDQISCHPIDGSSFSSNAFFQRSAIVQLLLGILGVVCSLYFGKARAPSGILFFVRGVCRKDAKSSTFCFVLVCLLLLDVGIIIIIIVLHGPHVLSHGRLARRI